MRGALLVTLVVTLPGCSGGGSGKLALSWQFVDGRRCPDTGTASMAVHVGDQPPASYLCSDGLAPQAVTLEGVPADGATVKVEALSTDSVPLYSGVLDLDALPAAATVTLYADKMR